MKKLTTILLSGMMIGFVGCGSTGELPDNEVGDDDTLQQGGSVVPQVLDGIGPEVKFQDYLFYNGDRINKETYLYDELIDGNLYYDIRKSVITKTTGNQGDLIATETIGEKIINVDVVDKLRITSFKYDANDKASTIYYPLNIQKNEEAITGIESTTCVLQDLDGGYVDLKSKLSLTVFNDLNNRDRDLNLNYLDVMHVYCGAMDGSTEDIYYASGFGKVLRILKSTDKTSYEIVCKNKFYE